MQTKEQMLITKYDLMFESRLSKQEENMRCLEKNLDETFKTLERSLDKTFAKIDQNLTELKTDMRWFIKTMFGFMVGISVSILSVLVSILIKGFFLP